MSPPRVSTAFSTVSIIPGTARTIHDPAGSSVSVAVGARAASIAATIRMTRMIREAEDSSSHPRPLRPGERAASACIVHSATSSMSVQ